MGGSKSKSSQSSTQQQITTTTQLSAADQAVLAYGGTALGMGATQLSGSGAQLTTGGATVSGKGNVVNVTTLDADVVAAALGTTRDVVERAYEVAGEFGLAALGTVDLAVTESLTSQSEAVREALDFGRDAGSAAFGFGSEALDFGREALLAVSGAQRDAVDLAENTNVTLARALEGFGTELSSVTERTTLAAQTGGASELTKGITTGALIAGALGAIYLFTRR